MEEIWKDIPEYEGLYQVSSLGRVKSLAREWEGGRGAKRKHPDIILKPDIEYKGYLSVSLTKDKKKKHFKVHRLVLSAFVGISDLQTNHKDGIKSNNYLNNLEYCTNSENVKHAYKSGLAIGLKGDKNPASKLTDEIIKNIRENKFNLSRKEFAVCYDVSASLINQVLNNKIWCHVS